MKTTTPLFKSLDKFEVEKGLVFVVKLDRTTRDFEHLIGKEVMVDDIIYIGAGVERYAHVAPWHKGESIGLLVKEDK